MTTTTLPPAADPGDVSSATTRRYEAEGQAAVSAALECSGPIKPVPYHADACEPAESIRRTALDVPLRVCVITSRPYLDWVLGNRPTRPTG